MRRDPKRAQLRAWLEYVAETAIEMLDAMDGDPDLEDDELGDEPEERKAA